MNNPYPLVDTFTVQHDILLLPKDTLAAMLDAKNLFISNYDLKLNKYVISKQVGSNGYEFALYRYDKKKKEITHWIAPTWDEKAITAFTKRKIKDTDNIQLTCTIANKALSHKGRASVYENNILLDKWYGFPYFSGKGMKGVIRNHIINECFGGYEDEAIKNPLFKYVFGYAEGKIALRGAVRFKGGYPTTPPILEPYITNNHFKDYYKEHKPLPPADWQAPNPIFFIIIRGQRDKKYSTFKFLAQCPNITLEELVILHTPKDKEENDEDYNKRIEAIIIACMPMEYAAKLNNVSKLKDWLEAWIRKTFEERGVGARRNVDYGRMKIE